MSRFLNATLSDLRGGCETWRVFLATGSPAFLVAVGVGMLRQIA